MAQITKPAFNWASVAKGKPQTIAHVEAEQAAIAEKVRSEKKERTIRSVKQAQDLAWQKQREEHDRKFSKEGGWLMGQWPTSNKVPYEPRLTVPKHVNERARDWVERALADWWPVWEKCETVEALRSAFIQAFVPYALEHGNCRRAEDYEDWEQTNCKSKSDHAERYVNMLKWVKEMEPEKPYWNPVWVACKNITFENCLWAMNVEARTFRAQDKLCPDTEVPITGFLQVEGQVVTWLADFTKYIPYKHDPKPKSKEAIEAKLIRDNAEFDRMLSDAW
jgi:hypothetical protein